MKFDMNIGFENFRGKTGLKKARGQGKTTGFGGFSLPPLPNGRRGYNKAKKSFFICQQKNVLIFCRKRRPFFARLFLLYFFAKVDR
jgi:hypothetical protein